jgi:hypothetical protein
MYITLNNFYCPVSRNQVTQIIVRYQKEGQKDHIIRLTEDFYLFPQYLLKNTYLALTAVN